MVQRKGNDFAGGWLGQVLALLDKLRIEDDGVRDWLRAVLASKTKVAVAESKSQRAEPQRQETLLSDQQDRLLNLAIDGEIDSDTFDRKQSEFRARLAAIKLQVDVLDRSRDENAELAMKVFELSQTLRQQWLSANYAEKRRIPKIAWLNCSLVGASHCPTIRKPFDVLAEGLVVPDSGPKGT